ncbi:hypothetical protein M513_04377 [Trichuris suis]|uniref:Integrase zinc-binding domain-containing protein n=1 Tax=Trichuris suis TaxID=68888 RepID=A0A085MBT1_9BILA|nr:hypothetical protein M513_04377 [Trichuris suis]
MRGRGWRIWVPELQRVVESRDCTFLEKEKGPHASPNKNNNEVVFTGGDSSADILPSVDEADESEPERCFPKEGQEREQHQSLSQGKQTLRSHPMILRNQSRTADDNSKPDVNEVRLFRGNNTESQNHHNISFDTSPCKQLKLDTPDSYLEAVSGIEAPRWLEAMKEEMESLREHNVDRALRACVSVAQHEGFEEEVACLLSNKSLKTQSNLLPLSPFIDNSGLMRVQGRVDKADIPYEARHPITLPPKHPLTKTIIEDMHRTLRHGSADLIRCELRQRYWLPKYRQRVKSVVYECVYCKKWRSKPSTPFMAQLPTERLQAFQPPFSCVGIDYFGPLTVLVRRSHEKRYGCLFTCMSTRAVHLEISFSLNTDSFLMAFRRFVDRRGTPAVAYSDNRTNFVAAERELRTCLQSWNQSKISEVLAQRRIRWSFSPLRHRISAEPGNDWFALQR